MTTHNDENGFREEAAVQFGFEWTNDDATEFKCTFDQLIAFAKACERKGMMDAYGIGSRDLVLKRVREIDVELAPILEAERQRVLAKVRPQVATNALS